MFGFGKKEKCLLAAATGNLVPLNKVPDEAFAGKLLGDGYAIEPTEGMIYSPCDGTVSEVTDTLHAYSITSDDGLDVLVHIGIDTVKLKGEGFTPLVKKGEVVRAGQPVAKVDLPLVRQNGLSTITPVVIANIEDIKTFTIQEGSVTGGESPALIYK